MQNKLPKKYHTQKLTEVQKYKESLDLLKAGSPQHQVAKERMLYLLVNDQEKVAKALIRKAKLGDVNAIKEYFDRLYGKSKETIDFNQNVKFSLKDLAKEREKLYVTLEENITDEPITILPATTEQNG